MKVFVATLLAASMVVGIAGEASAAQKRKYKHNYHSYRYEQGYGYRADSGWYPRDSNQLRYGSRLWFDQMEREGRFGGRGRR
jgi:hypothetical protein